MRHQIRQFLGLEPSRTVGRWFSVVLLIGVGAVLYSSIGDWPYFHGARRVALAAKILAIVLGAAVIIILAEKQRRIERAQPPA